MAEDPEELSEPGADTEPEGEGAEEREHYRYRRRRHHRRRGRWPIVLLLIVIVAGGLGVYYVLRARARSRVFYSAVLLDNGQVYYGKIQSTGDHYTVLVDVYYVQQKVNPQTKEVANVLIQRGKEWHAPDHMELNNRHIVMIEPVSPQSKVAQLIYELKEKGQ
jgi:hypothetical protein